MKKLITALLVFATVGVVAQSTFYYGVKIGENGTVIDSLKIDEDSLYVYGSGMTYTIGWTESAAGDLTAPSVLSAEIGNLTDSSVVVIFDENLHQGFTPATSTFDFTEDAISATISSLSVSHDTLFIELSTAVTNGTTLLLDYNQPGVNGLRDSSSNLVNSFIAQSVTNNVSGGGSEPLAANIDFYSDQSTLTTVSFARITTNAVENELIVNWGDGNTTARSTSGDAITHDYSTEGIYHITLSGDVDSINVLNISTSTGGTLSANIEDWLLPKNLVTLNLDVNGTDSIYGYLDKVNWSNCEGSINMYLDDNYIKLNADNFLASNMPPNFLRLDLDGCDSIAGDLSGFELPLSCLEFLAYGSAMTTAGITAPPRGELLNISKLEFRYHAITTENIDAWLVYARNYFTTNTPIKDMLVDIRLGSNQDPTDGASNADLVALQTLFTNAGYTLTFYQ